MRRSVVILLMTIALVSALAMPALARDKMAVGIADPDRQTIGGVNAYLAEIGADTNPARTPSFWTVWSQWGHFDGADCYPAAAYDCAFPTAFLNQLDALDISPIIWWQPHDPGQQYPDGERFARHKNTYQAGMNDQYLNNWIDDLKAFGQAHPGRKVYVRLAHEPDGDFFSWRTGNWDNTTQTYKLLWRYVWDKFQARGALPYVEFIWGVKTPKWALYPGNKYVDFVDPLSLNWPGAWKGLYKKTKTKIQQFNKFTSKPIIITEIGSAPGPKNKAKWIQNGFNKVYNKYPRVKGMVYVDSDQPYLQQGHADWSLNTPPAAMQAYIDHVVRKAQFQGRR